MRRSTRKREAIKQPSPTLSKRHARLFGRFSSSSSFFTRTDPTNFSRISIYVVYNTRARVRRRVSLKYFPPAIRIVRFLIVKLFQRLLRWSFSLPHSCRSFVRPYNITTEALLSETSAFSNRSPAIFISPKRHLVYRNLVTKFIVVFF